MNPLQQERLARFVDRESEMQSFCRMLDEASGARPVLIVWGESGMGKTVLLSRMMHECSLRSLVKAEVLWSDTRSHDYLGVMRKVRDDVGAIKFQQSTFSPIPSRCSESSWSWIRRARLPSANTPPSHHRLTSIPWLVSSSEI